ncbi:MAG: ATP-binding protein [Candidatus Brocadiia bacterium]
MAKLVVVSGGSEGQSFSLEEDMLVGRSEECDVLLNDLLASRQHARIQHLDDGWFIEDLGSANGTKVNGAETDKGQLHDGDWISIGESKLTFVLDDDFKMPRPALAADTAVPEVMQTLDVVQTAPGIGEDSTDALVNRLRQHLSTLRQVAEASCGTLVLEDLLQRILNQLLRVYPQADHAHGMLRGFGRDDADLHLSASRPGRESADGGMSRTLFEMATGQGKAVLADAGADARLQDAQSIVGHGLCFMMCSPLMVGSRTLGAIQVDTTDATRPFTGNDLQLLVTVAGQVAVAAENAHLHGRVVAQQRLAAVGEAIASIAHCIKNTVNAMAGGSYIVDLGMQNQNLDKVAKGWDMVSRSTDFMTDLVRDMLLYCRQGGLRRTPTDAAELLQETVAAVRQSASEDGIEIALNAQEDLPEAHLDPTGIRRVVLNLLTNAIEACPAGSRVEVRAALAEGGEALRISVADDGPGIPPEVRARLFEPFFTTRGSEGTGLGLAVVQRVIQEHGGEVEVESEPGSGAAFHMTIPLESEQVDTKLAE